MSPWHQNTIADLSWLRERGWDRYIFAHYRAGGWVLGICGGYQMLGGKIADPEHVESAVPEASGLNLLPIETIFATEKITSLVTAFDHTGTEVCGYEIHCGRIIGGHHRSAFRIRERDGNDVDEPEGVVSDDGRVLGTSVHGLMDGSVFRRHYLNHIRERKRLGPLPVFAHHDARSTRIRAYDRVADILANHLDVSAIATLVGLSGFEFL